MTYLGEIIMILQVMSVKALGTSLKLTFEGNNQLIYPETWFFLLVVATCVITQLNYLNKVCTKCALTLGISLHFESFWSLKECPTPSKTI